MQLSVNRKEQALDSLEQAYAEHSCWLVNLKVVETAASKSLTAAHLSLESSEIQSTITKHNKKTK